MPKQPEMAVILDKYKDDHTTLKKQLYNLRLKLSDKMNPLKDDEKEEKLHEIEKIRKEIADINYKSIMEAKEGMKR